MKPALQLRLSQQLTMTPQLQQAIRLLQLPVIELQAQLQQALADNVMLELVDPVEFRSESQDSAVVAGDDPILWNEPSSGGSSSWSDGATRPEPVDTSHDTLRDHLLWQLEMDHFSLREVQIGQAVVDAVNDAGYLTEE